MCGNEIKKAGAESPTKSTSLREDLLEIEFTNPMGKF